MILELCYSGEDRMLPSTSEANRLKKLIPGCRVRYFKDSGHTLLLVYPNLPLLCFCHQYLSFVASFRSANEFMTFIVRILYTVRKDLFCWVKVYDKMWSYCRKEISIWLQLSKRVGAIGVQVDTTPCMTLLCPQRKKLRSTMVQQSMFTHFLTIQIGCWI